MKKLKRRGLVIITTSTSDYMTKIVGLTEAGLELLARQDAVHITTEEKLLRPLDLE